MRRLGIDASDKMENVEVVFLLHSDYNKELTL